ncbi:MULTISPECIES: 3-isopropylmalate dehydratase small subunit [Acidiplasma]|uniref:3-isopropylmalate dehydratase small subunit n=1 Tax=Acidiplasma aeolicum TaxID=507754 RepID=A0A0P9DA51_9ARCH|nr:MULTISPECIES: 3-isopropylmalate dehydratase small subunit [Acidiplasma]KJE48979.1 3-isopropylmalate dehydratase [Acidiplasma sp. MBA-1]KPV46475.1 3-isopropylmalate dehydratase [Acidiplasma aeolicum]KQB35545.1 3-isopropylmalate dehydratase [Acidiplasma aeolicum]WMT54407.1 MAG: 3-isopropylmalate dehydratase small subunit [Acidiplasma sp.]
MNDRITGNVWVLGDDIDTDQIIPARYLVTSDEKELAKHFMEYTDPELAGKIKPGDVIIAGKNFGSGSSREHAVLTIKGLGISCVIAESFARIFFRNAINLGMPLIEAKINANSGDKISIDFNDSVILINNKKYTFKKYPDFLKNIINAGGLINYVREYKW